MNEAQVELLVPVTRFGADWTGVVLPGIVFFVSLYLTIRLYQRFSAPHDG